MLCVRCLESNIRSDLVFRASHWLSLGHWPIRGNQSRVESEKSVLTSILGLIWFSRLPIGRRWITSQSEATKVESCQIRPGGGVPFVLKIGYEPWLGFDGLWLATAGSLANQRQSIKVPKHGPRSRSFVVPVSFRRATAAKSRRPQSKAISSTSTNTDRWLASDNKRKKQTEDTKRKTAARCTTSFPIVFFLVRSPLPDLFNGPLHLNTHTNTHAHTHKSRTHSWPEIRDAWSSSA